MIREDIFWSRVKKTNTCWNWVGSIEKDGYGRFSQNGKYKKVHRLSYEHSKDKIPIGLTIDHLCRNRICVNPSHMEVVTNIENVMRGNGVMAKHARQTHCKRGHELNKENIYNNKNNWRICKICGREKGRKHYIYNKDKISIRRKILYECNKDEINKRRRIKRKQLYLQKH